MITGNYSKVSECWVVVKRGRLVDNGTFWYIDAVEEAIGLMMTMKNLLFDYSDDAIKALAEFQERFFDSVIMR